MQNVVARASSNSTYLQNTLIAICILAADCSFGQAQRINVSPSGAIQTLQQARDEARLQRASGVRGTISITLHTGLYQLTKTLELTSADSDITWTAATGENPVISGGRLLTGWVKQSDRLWTTNAPGPFFRQMFVDGHRAIRARTPNFGYFRIDGESSRAKPFELHFRGDDIKSAWANSPDAEVIALLAWSDLRMHILSIDNAKHLATLSSPPADSNHEKDGRYFIENTLDSLDAPGEWFLDNATHIVSYRPIYGEDMTRAVVVVPALTQLITIRGEPNGRRAHDINFRGLTFEHADWTMAHNGYADTQAATPSEAAIDAMYVDHLIFDHCTFTHSGGYALSLNKGAQNNSVTASEFFDLGGGGIRIGDYDLAKDDIDRSFGNTVADNNLHDLGKVFAAGVGVLILQSSHNRIIHNHIHDLFYTGISVGWTWGYAANQSKGNLIAYNHIHDLGKGQLSDLGGIYTLGEQPGTVVRNNLVHDIMPFTYGGWGLYTDEGSSNILFENNIVYNCNSAGFHQNIGRNNVLRNNIFAFNREAQLMRTQSEAPNSFTFDHNIVYFDEGNLLGKNWNDNTFTMKNNLYYTTQTANPSFYGKTFAEWQESGQDLGSVVQDPLFRNAGSYDFRLLPTSPALRLGFHSIDMSTVGPRITPGAVAWNELHHKPTQSKLETH